MRWLIILISSLLVFGCSSIPIESPPLRDLEEPLEAFVEPDDEALREKLPRGGFTGIYVEDARKTLDQLVGDPEGLIVDRIVENSPAMAAGLAVGDVLLEVIPSGKEPIALAWKSQWRKLELESGAGKKLRVVYDRGGVEHETELAITDRLRLPDREEVERIREEQRVGVVVRTPTEVESRRVGLAPGAGAVVVGLSLSSPFRMAGIRFGDLISHVDDRSIDDPQALLDEIRAADEKAELLLTLYREGEKHQISAVVSSRAQELSDFTIPLIFSYSNDPDRSQLSLLLGLFGVESTEAAWKVRLLWFITFGGGDSDRLAEVAVSEQERSKP